MSFGLGMLFSDNVARVAQIDAENRIRRPQVYSHELAHQTAAGNLAGAIVIEKNADGLITGGHVDIKMPALDPSNPQKTQKDAQTVINAAMAPSDPSTQDYNVAASARETLQLAQKAITDNNTGSKLDIAA